MEVRGKISQQNMPFPECVGLIQVDYLLFLIKMKRNTTNRDDVLADQISREQEKHIL